MPLLVVSARRAEGEKIQALDRGADDHIGKPFSKKELIARLRLVLCQEDPAFAADDA